MSEPGTVNPCESSAERSAARRPAVPYDNAPAEIVQTARKWATAIPAMQMTLACWLLLLVAALVVTAIACLTTLRAFLAPISPFGLLLIGAPLVLDVILLFVLNNYIRRIEQFAKSPTKIGLDRALRGSTHFWTLCLILCGMTLVFAAANLAVTLYQLSTLIQTY